MSTLMVPSPNHLCPAHHSKKPNQRPKKYQSSRTSPLHIFNSHKDEDSSSYCSDGSQESSTGNKKRIHKLLHRHKKDDKGALSDSECQNVANNKQKKNKSNRDFLKAPEVEPSKFKRGGSLNLGSESKKYREKFNKRSVRSTSVERHAERTTDSDKEDDILLRSK